MTGTWSLQCDGNNIRLRIHGGATISNIKGAVSFDSDDPIGTYCGGDAPVPSNELGEIGDKMITTARNIEGVVNTRISATQLSVRIADVKLHQANAILELKALMERHFGKARQHVPDRKQYEYVPHYATAVA